MIGPEPQQPPSQSANVSTRSRLRRPRSPVGTTRPRSVEKVSNLVFPGPTPRARGSRERRRSPAGQSPALTTAAPSAADQLRAAWLGGEQRLEQARSLRGALAHHLGGGASLGRSTGRAAPASTSSSAAIWSDVRTAELNSHARSGRVGDTAGPEWFRQLDEPQRRSRTIARCSSRCDAHVRHVLDVGRARHYEAPRSSDQRHARVRSAARRRLGARTASGVEDERSQFCGTAGVPAPGCRTLGSASRRTGSPAPAPLPPHRPDRSHPCGTDKT